MLALRQSEWQSSNVQNISLKTLYGGQFTLVTKLMIPNYPSTFITSYLPTNLRKKTHFFRAFNARIISVLWSSHYNFLLDLKLKTTIMNNLLLLPSPLDISAPARHGILWHDQILQGWRPRRWRCRTKCTSYKERRCKEIRKMGQRPSLDSDILNITQEPSRYNKFQSLCSTSSIRKCVPVITVII